MKEAQLHDHSGTLGMKNTLTAYLCLVRDLDRAIDVRSRSCDGVKTVACCLLLAASGKVRQGSPGMRRGTRQEGPRGGFRVTRVSCVSCRIRVGWRWTCRWQLVLLYRARLTLLRSLRAYWRGLSSSSPPSSSL